MIKVLQYNKISKNIEEGCSFDDKLNAFIYPSFRKILIFYGHVLFYSVQLDGGTDAKKIIRIFLFIDCNLDVYWNVENSTYSQKKKKIFPIVWQQVIELQRKKELLFNI